MLVLVKAIQPDVATRYADIKKGDKLNVIRKDEVIDKTNPRTMYLVESMRTKKWITLYGSEITVIEKINLTKPEGASGAESDN